MNLIISTGLFCVIVTGFLPLHCYSAEPAALLPDITNGSFENQLEGWKLGALSELSKQQAATGQYSLKISDDSDQNGSEALAARVPVGAGIYTLRGKVFTVSGSGLGVYLRFMDSAGKVGPEETHVFQRTVPSTPRGQWVPFELTGIALKNAAFAEVWLHSYNNAKVVAYIDDLSLAPAPKSELATPWKGTYKIKPSEKARLTAADVVGPDGVVYPDWKYAGKPGGIPRIKTVAKIEEFAGKANDDLDDSEALEKGAETIGKRGGGALLLGEGTYYLDRPIWITRDNVVIRGLGANRTKLVFRYNKVGETPSFAWPRAGQTIDANTWIEANADPTDLKALEIQVDGQTVTRRDKNLYANATYSVTALGSNVLDKVADKNTVHQLKIIAEYKDGKTRESSASFRTTSATPTEGARALRDTGAINFAGVSQKGPQHLLARDGKRGDQILLLQDASGLHAGSRIYLTAPATPRWNQLVGNTARWGDYRRYELQVTRVRGNEITINQPLRLDYPTIDGAFVAEIFPLRNCGVENLSLEQTHKLWTSGIIFSNAWECWARGVTVKKAGRFPLYGTYAKWLEIRDCVVDDVWHKGDGGTGYVGWDYCYDSLMDGITTYKVRHAPLLQWSAAGNVIRRGVFHDSDAQWHAGWTNENLIEQCVIESVTGNGGYGYGMLSTAPDDSNHGPNGPRNVIYNCDVSSPKSGVWMGGMNENWLFLHNRFVVGSGPGVFGQKGSFDHIFKDNVFILKDINQPAFMMRSPNCVGWELTGNIIVGGNGQLTGGFGEALVATGNTMLPMGEATRPKPKIPSLFEWQRRNK
ncbi:hypothetical protein EON83_06005 [bacterium]|nr:MAG: hypothetical protein EON83_06005 [bacterium]